MNGQKLCVGVVGAGTMGRGIAQLFAEAGHEVRLFDTFEGAAAKARQFIDSLIQRSVAKGQRSAEQAQTVVDRVQACAQLQDLAPCALVIEAIVEDLAAKRALFDTLECVVSSDAILASNTSSLLVADIATRSRHPERIAGLHFFNPVPLMKVVEVIAAVRTSPAVIETLRACVAGTGHRAVVAADQPGFLVNHAGRGLYTEGLRLLEEQVAEVAEVDALVREAGGFRMGPFELMDLTGLDVSSKVMQSIYEQFQHEPRFRPSSLVPPRVAAGLFGRKAGGGWYAYEGEAKVVPALAEPAPIRGYGARVWIDPAADEHAELEALVRGWGAEVSRTPDADLLIIQPWGTDASGYCIANRLDATRTVALDPLPSLRRRRTLMLTASTAPRARDLAFSLLGTGDPGATIIGDSPGFVVQRLFATIVNIAANIAQRGIAAVADIEDAVRLGLGYPQGPLALGDEVDPTRVLAILRNMQACTGDPRYRPSPWLIRRAGLGLSLLAPEAARR